MMKMVAPVLWPDLVVVLLSSLSVALNFFDPIPSSKKRTLTKLPPSNQQKTNSLT